MRLAKSILFAAAATLGLAATAAAQTQVQWMMASGYPENNFMTQNLRLFVNEVESPKLKIVLHTNDSLIKLDNIKRAVQTGQVQGGEIRLGVYGNEDPMFILDGVPFLASTYDQSWKLMQAQKAYFDALFAKNAMKVLGYQIWPSQGFYTKTAVKGPEDFKGKKLRIYSTATQRMGTLLGFNATILPFAEIPQAFSTGLIESLFTSAQTGTDIQAWDNTKYFTNVGGLLSKNALIVNARAFAQLPKETQAAMVKAGETFTERSWSMSKAAHEEKATLLKKNGMQIDEAPATVIDAMKAVGKQMTEEWKQTASPTAVESLNKYLTAAN